jgi:translation initiation factor 1 (eIF-1/SUI1)
LKQEDQEDKAKEEAPMAELSSRKEKIDQEAKTRAADSGPADLATKGDRGITHEGSQGNFGGVGDMAVPFETISVQTRTAESGPVELPPKGDQSDEEQEDEEDDDIEITVDFRDKGQRVTVELYRGEEWTDFKSYIDYVMNGKPWSTASGKEEWRDQSRAPKTGDIVKVYIGIRRPLKTVTVVFKGREVALKIEEGSEWRQFKCYADDVTDGMP